MVYRVVLDSTACIGCVACTRCECFEMGQDMKAHAVEDLVVEIGCIREVAEGCPVGAISICDIQSH